ncbi:MAG: hypothetical protein ACREFW_05555 [Rhizomicrobium sp.]
MAARDILSFQVSMGERLIRLLYAIALILIAIGVIFGLWRGAVLISRSPLPPPTAVSRAANPPAATPAPQGSQPAAQNPRVRGRFIRFGHRRYFMMRRHPVRSGVFVIIRTLVSAFIALLIVRILAELGLAILAMPRRTA